MPSASKLVPAQAGIRDEGFVRNKAVYIALGILPDGTKEILGIWIEQTEGAKFWLKVMNELKARGINDVLVAVVDGLKGFPDAITAVFPQAIVQTPAFAGAGSALCTSFVIRSTLYPGKTVSKWCRRSRPFTAPLTLRLEGQRWMILRLALGAYAIRPSCKAGGVTGNT